MLCERSLEHNQELYICFVDFEKAFDRVNWIKLMEILEKCGLDWRDRRMIRNLYMNQEGVVKVNGDFTEECLIGRGVRQGCCLSPVLFSLYTEMMMLEALENIDEGVKIGGRSLSDIRFADDQAMISGTQKGLQVTMKKLCDVVERYGMKINSKKTKVMKISRVTGSAMKIVVNDTVLQQVKSFKYLGSIIENRMMENAKQK